MPDIVLATLNAKYIHAAFGLRYLLANLGELRPRAEIAEFDINQRPLEIVERLLERQPRIIGLGVYIWNTAPTLEVVSLLKKLRPDVTVILGGPEVSFECDRQEIIELADHTITGEADVKFAEVCTEILAGKKPAKLIIAELPKTAELTLPYEFYTDDDIAHRVLYVEASRGCPFTCEFCLSSLDVPVRAFPLEPFLAAMERLIERGAREFKFVDRTFNLHLPTASAILRFFLERWRDGMFVHFEMVPDRLPDQLRELIAQFPPGGLQFEVGIQTFDDQTGKNISRRQNIPKLEDNLRWLRGHTGVHVHADLIAGLPGENLESFARGFDRLVALGPQEIQLGILKRLRGTPIVRHDAEFAMLYAAQPPYEILQNRDLDFPTMQRVRRMARYWDLIANSGNFTATTALLWHDGASAFDRFWRFAAWLHTRLRRTHQIALAALAESLFIFLTEELHLPRPQVAETLRADFARTGRRDGLAFLDQAEDLEKPSAAARSTSRRQSRHLGQPTADNPSR